MTVTHSVVTAAIKGLMSVLCRIDAAQMERVPDRGPLIIVANHVSSLEVPIMYTQLHPRPATAFVKVETWDHPVFGPLANLWGAIPLHRGEADTVAFRLGLDALADGRILAVAPEGTRSHDGQLQRGVPGVVLLALRSGAPLLPIAYYGGEDFRPNLRKLRRTDFHIVVGEPFVLDPGDEPVTRQLRQTMVDEMMYRLAALLPPEYRGVYADIPDPLGTYTHPTTLSPTSPA